MTLSQFFFFYHATVITVLSLVTITRRNPVHAVLAMLVMFFHIAGMYLFLNAEFIAALQIIVYAGAILILFLFVVFILDLRTEEKALFSSNWPTGAVLSMVFFFVMAMATRGFQEGAHGKYTVDAVSSMTHTKAIGTVLYTQYIFPFELASIVLLVAIVGAISLAKKRLTT